VTVRQAIETTLAGGEQPSSEVKLRAAALARCSGVTVQREARRMTERGELVIVSEGFPRRTT
jgi:hypothetical protein